MPNRTRPGLVTTDLERFIDVDLLGDGTSFAEMVATVPVDKTGAVIAVGGGTQTSAAGDGVDGTGIAPPTGGSGIRGWLSGIYSRLAPLLIARSAVAVVSQASAAQTANGVSANLSVGAYTELLLLVNVSATAGTTPSMTLYIDTLGADGAWYPVYTSAPITAAGPMVATVGAGAQTNQGFGSTVRLRWAITGAAPSFTFSANITGK